MSDYYGSTKVEIVFDCISHNYWEWNSFPLWSWFSSKPPLGCTIDKDWHAPLTDSSPFYPDFSPQFLIDRKSSKKEWKAIKGTGKSISKTHPNFTGLSEFWHLILWCIIFQDFDTWSQKKVWQNQVSKKL